MKAFGQSPMLVRILIGLLALEAVVVLATFLAIAVEFLLGNYQNFYAEIFLLVVSIGAFAWVVKFSFEILRRKRWARSAAFFWQLLQAAVGAGALAEPSGNRVIGAALVLLSAATMLLLFNRTVVEATGEGVEG